jgi:hypothetical protein
VDSPQELVRTHRRPFGARRRRVDSPAAVVIFRHADDVPVSQRELASWWPLMATSAHDGRGGALPRALARACPTPPNLAGYGVAFARIILEAPIIMMLSAATALVTDRLRHAALRRFATGRTWAVTASMVRC